MTKPLLNQRYELSLKAVLLRCLDADQRLIRNANASGFIRRENGKLYLYTCWHVVTGHDPNDIKIGSKRPNRSFLQLEMQDSQQRQAGTIAIGGLQSLTIPLYDTSYSPHKPLWLQDDRHIPQTDLNAISIFVPFWHDAVKIALPPEVRISDLQVAEDDSAVPPDAFLTVGDKLYLVGYPYGFSIRGAEQPTPIVLTRFAASSIAGGMRQSILLDSAGAPGMSGGPVFLERDSSVRLFGIYTGAIFPDHVIERNEKTTALGTFANMMMCWWSNALPLVSEPSQAHVT
jgi:trypsin-like peptidase